MRRLVDVVLELDELSINYKVEFTPEEALEFVRKATAYNGFTAQDLANLITKINKLISPIKFPQPDNPNNGKMHHKFHIGNEGSRVIYLDVHKFYLREDFQGFKTDYEKLAEQLEALAKKAHATEYGVVRNDNYDFIYRFWWD